MTTLLSKTSNVVPFFILLVTLVRTHSYKKQCLTYSLTLPLWLLIFYTLSLSSLFDNFFLYIAFMAVGGFLYALLFISGKLPNILALLISLLFSIISLKGVATQLIWILFPTDRTTAVSVYLYYLIFYLSIFLCGIFYKKHPLHSSYGIPVKYWLIMILTTVILAVLSQLYIRSQRTLYSATPLTLLFLLIIFFAILATYYLSYLITSSYESLFESQKIKQRLELQLEHLDRSSMMIEQLRRDKHEMKNIYFYLNSLIQTNNLQELEEFVEQKLMRRYSQLEEVTTGNEFIDYLLTQKINEAHEYHIHTVTDILLPTDLSIDSDDLCGLLLNIFDNAIDASKKEPHGDIQIYMKHYKSYLSIKLRNKTSSDILKSNPQLLTTKKNSHSHGIGLQVVRSIVKKYNGILNTSMNSGYFVVDILLELN